MNEGSFLYATPNEVEASTQRLIKNTATEDTICIVGAGLTGIEAAKVMQAESGRPVIILERGNLMGGIWIRNANPESTVQVDPISFAPVEDTSPIRTVDDSNPYENIALDAGEVCARLCDHVRRFKVKDITVFGVEVVRFYKPEGASFTDPVQVDIRILSTGEVIHRTFREFHLRVGNLLKPRNIKFPGETGSLINSGAFKGESYFGIGGDIKLEQFKNKHVTIIGSGAFAIENVRRALMGGAKTPIVVLARDLNKCWFPEFATYTLRNILNSYSEPAKCQQDLGASVAMWRRAVEIITTAATACGTTDKTMNAKCIRTINGEKHVLFNRAVPPLSSNLMFLAYYYGLVKYEEDEVATCEGTQVHTVRGNTYPADIFIKNAGFDHNDTLLQEHVCNDAYFVDNQVNITHNCRGDRINGTIIFGPHSQCRNFLISYYEDSQEYERPIVVLNKHPELYQELLLMDPQRHVCDIAMVDYLTTIHLSDKIARLSHPEIQRVLTENLQRRHKMYDEHLTKDKFSAADKKYWEKLSRHFEGLSNNAKPFLAYPF